MKKSKVIFLALLACAFGASARTVTRADAEYAARRWASSGAVLERPIGQTLVSSETLTATNSAVLHAVRFDGGTAFVSGDTELEPIIAFTTSTNFTPSADNKLWRLLKRDTIVRNAALMLSKSANLKATASAGFTAQMAASTSAASGKWAKLLEGMGTQSNRKAFGATPPNKLEGISDVRCAPLLKTQWSQTDDEQFPTSHNCYNLYTPNNAPCGCTATAMSQIMRYYEFPKNSIAAKTYECSVDGVSKNLTMQGGTYDWGKMTLCPNSSSYVKENWEAIGKLTSDVGIALQTSYDSPTATSYGSGSSYVSLVGEVLKEAFGYANGACIFNWGIAEEAAYGDGYVYSDAGLHKLAVREKVIYANLDAKCPVELGVYGYGDEQIGDRDYWEGHAIVGDGYGYSEYAGEKVPYVHINLGWHGLDDAWYNIPEIHSPNSGSYIGSEGTAFTVLSAAAYNLFPTNTGNIVAGRVFDDEGEAISGVKITIREAGSAAVIEERTTDAQGIYAFIVPGGKDYDISCFVANKGIEDTHTVNVPKETLECNDTYGVYTEKDANVGNYWGHDADFEIVDPCVSNLMQGVAYTRLDRALETVSAGDILAIIKEAPLKRSVTVAVSCTIFATNENAAASAVTCLNGAQITIVDGATVTMTNVVFDVEGATKTVLVEDGGVLKIGGVCGLGSVETADADNLIIVSGLSEPLRVDCTGAVKKGEVFARGTLDVSSAQACAYLLMHYENTRLGGSATDAGGSVDFRWAQGIPVPRSEAVGQLNGENYRSLGDIFEDFAQDTNTEIVIFKDAAFTNHVALLTNLIIRGEGDARPVLTAAGTSGFYIPDDVSLTVSNVVFRGYVDDDPSDYYGFLVIDGGELTLEDGAVLDSMTGKVNRGSGIVDIWTGTATMRKGAEIVNCRAEGGTDSGGFGGAIYTLYENGGVLNLEGGVITNCYASSYGGGIYVDEWYGSSSVVNISGDLTVADNWSAASLSDDICLYTSRVLPNFRMSGPLSGTNVVGVWISMPIEDEKEINAEGSPFATNVAGVAVAPAFFNDTDDILTAVAGESGMLVWTKRIPDDGQCAEELASAHIYHADGTVQHYTNLVTAIAYMTNGTAARIEMYRGAKGSPNKKLNQYDTILTPIALPADCHLSLTAGEDGYCVRRYRSTGITIPSSSSLTVTNLVMYCHQANPGTVTNAFLDVRGGALTLADGACVSNILGNTSRDAAAIAVYDGGTITMLSGSRIVHCSNYYNRDGESFESQHYGVGGGILVDNGTAYMHGGEITDCRATRGGGVCVDNGSKAYVSGDMRIWGNRWITNGVDRGSSDIYVADEANLYLDGKLTGKIGAGGERRVKEGTDTNLVAEVSYVWTNDVETLTNSAAKFVHDFTGDTGVAVTNGTKALVVWCGAVRGGVYTNVSDGVEYKIVGYESPTGAELLPTLSSESGIEAELAKLNDTTVGMKITTLDEYNAFASWAASVEGGKEAVRDSAHAYESYEFGTTNLFENTPAVAITEVVGADGGLTVSVVVKDGEDVMAVASAKVKSMFEGTTDVNDWTTASKKLDLAADGVTTDLTNATEKRVEFTIKPVGNPGKAFIRLKY